MSTRFQGHSLTFDPGLSWCDHFIHLLKSHEVSCTKLHISPGVEERKCVQIVQVLKMFAKECSNNYLEFLCQCQICLLAFIWEEFMDFIEDFVEDVATVNEYR